MAGSSSQEKHAVPRPQKQAAKCQQGEEGEPRLHRATAKPETNTHTRCKEVSSPQGLALASGAGEGDGDGEGDGVGADSPSQAGSWISWEASC